jgi:hypothetical protein
LTDPNGKRLDPITQEVTDKFNQFTIDNASLGNGKMGKKVIAFNNRDLTEDETEQILDYEEQQESYGNPVRHYFINVERLRNIFATWYIAVIQKQKPGSDLDKVMFQDKLNQAASIFQITQKPLAGDTIAQDFMTVWKAKGWFQPAAAAPTPNQVSPNGMPPGMGPEASPNITPTENKPTINTMMGSGADATM